MLFEFFEHGMVRRARLGLENGVMAVDGKQKKLVMGGAGHPKLHMWVDGVAQPNRYRTDRFRVGVGGVSFDGVAGEPFGEILLGTGQAVENLLGRLAAFVSLLQVGFDRLVKLLACGQGHGEIGDPGSGLKKSRPPAHAGHCNDTIQSCKSVYNPLRRSGGVVQ